MFRSGIGVWLRCFWNGFNPLLQNIFHVEINENARNMHKFLIFLYSFITLDCSQVYLICTVSISRKQSRCRNESQLGFPKTIEREEDGCKYICIATHFKKEQYSTFVERTLTANGCLSDLSLELLYTLYIFIYYLKQLSSRIY